MKLHLFGPFRLEFAGQTRLLTGPHAALLGLLALNEASGHAVTRTRLAGTLWPDVAEERARRLLSNALYRLRRLLGDAAAHLVVDADVVALRDVWVDTAVFRQLLSSNKTTDWITAFDLYVGDLLEEQDGFWLLSARAELRERFLTALARAAAQLEADGQPELALLVARRWTLADPLNEMAHMTAMRLLSDQGRTSAALQQYETLVNLLADELDVPPLPETESLAQTIRRERERLTALETKTAVPFIGRQQERAQIIARLEKLKSGELETGDWRLENRQSPISSPQSPVSILQSHLPRRRTGHRQNTLAGRSRRRCRMARHPRGLGQNGRIRHPPPLRPPARRPASRHRRATPRRHQRRTDPHIARFAHPVHPPPGRS